MSRSPATHAAEEPGTDTGPANVRVTYRKSSIGYAQDQKATVVALGLHRLRQTVEHPDTPVLRDMVQKVRHLVSVDGVPADSVAVAARLASGGPLGAGHTPDAQTRRES